MAKKYDIEGQISFMDMITGSKSKDAQQDTVKIPATVKKTGTRKRSAGVKKETGHTKDTDKKRQADVLYRQETKNPAAVLKKQKPVKPDPEKDACMEAVRNAVRHVEMKPGARYRIEVLIKEDEMKAFAKVPHEFASLVYTESDISILFKQSVIICTHNGKKTHIMWFPVFEYIKGLVDVDTWLTAKERKKEELADAEKKEKRRWCM